MVTSWDRVELCARNYRLVAINALPVATRLWIASNKPLLEMTSPGWAKERFRGTRLSLEFRLGGLDVGDGGNVLVLALELFLG